MKFLLYLKPWKLFFIFFICMILSCSPSFGTAAELVFWVMYTGWVYHIGVTMHGLIPPSVRPKISYFKFNCLFIQFIALLFVFVTLIATVFNISIPNLSDNIRSITLGIYLGYSIWCWIYISMFAARMLESVIEGKLVNKSDSLKGFVCLLFFPYGVWYIQPAVQQVLRKYEHAKGQPVNNN